MSDETPGPAKPVTDDEAPQPAPQRRLRMLLTVAAASGLKWARDRAVAERADRAPQATVEQK